MSEHKRFIQEIYFLMEECGIPEKNPGPELYAELFWMIQEHCGDFGVDLE